MTIRRPLVFVPGFMGSQLWSQEFPHQRLWPFWHFNAKGGIEFSSLKALITTNPKTPGELIPEIYAGMKNHFNNMGYTYGKDYWDFAYDWTQDITLTCRELERFIRKRVRHDCDAVDVVCHSMGGIVTRAAIEVLNAPIRRAVYLACPHHGAPQAYFALHPKTKFNFFKSHNFVADWIWKKYARQGCDESHLGDQINWVTRRISSLYYLLPDKFYLDNAVTFAESETINDHPFNDYPIGTSRVAFLEPDEVYFRNRLTCFEEPQDRTLAGNALKFKESLGPYPKGKYLVIYSDSEETSDSIVVHRKIYGIGSMGEQNVYFFHETFPSQQKDSGQRGDGVVPTHSATAGLLDCRNVEGTHLGIPNAEAAYRLIRNFLESQ